MPEKPYRYTQPQGCIDELLTALLVTANMLAFEAKCLRENGHPDKAKPLDGQVNLVAKLIAKAKNGPK